MGPPIDATLLLDRAAIDRRDDLLFAAMASTRMPMVVTDPHAPDHPIVFVNEAFGTMSGYSVDETVGRNCRFLQGRDTDPLAVDAIRQAVRARTEISIEILNYRKDGSAFWNALFVSPVFDREGALIYYFASQFDVSPRRDAVAALGQAQKLEALGQLTGGISHDFNNLLQVMIGHVEILERRLRVAPIDVRAIGTSSRSIRQAVEKASTLTRQLLAFARKQRLEGRLVNLNRVAGDLADLARRTLGADIEMVTDFAPDLDDCLIDPVQFEVALLHILANARDAIDGRGTVTVRTANLDVGPDTHGAFVELETGRYVMISVSDDGPGIAPELVSRVVEPFFTTKDEGRGTGLGLSMVHGFAKQSGGALQIRSGAGGGTTIDLYFSASDTVANGLPGRLRAVAEQSGGERILAVDDRPELLSIVRSLLEELGYDVRTAGGAAEAVEVVGSLAVDERPALLFSDVIMPGGMNGYVLARKLRQIVPGLKVLLTSGYTGDVHGRSTAVGSEFEVIEKPYRLDDLARRVRSVLDKPG